MRSNRSMTHSPWSAHAVPGTQPQGGVLKCWRQQQSPERLRVIGSSRGDGIIDARTAGGRQRGSSRGDGIILAKMGVAREQKSSAAGRFIGVSRVDGIIAAKAMGSRQRGFSLIEIILVVVLIGGIVAFAATRILGGGDRARVNLGKAQVQTLAEKVQQFEMDTGGLPNSLDELVNQPGNAAGWLGPYAKPAELNDPWNTPFEYRVPGESQAFDIISLGADKRAGGDSVDADIRYE
jgi:general secretion pathway protein G